MNTTIRATDVTYGIITRNEENANIRHHRLRQNEKARVALSHSIQAFAKPNAAVDIYEDLLLLSQKEV